MKCQKFFKKENNFLYFYSSIGLIFRVWKFVPLFRSINFKKSKKMSLNHDLKLFSEKEI